LFVVHPFRRPKFLRLIFAFEKKFYCPRNTPNTLKEELIFTFYVLSFRVIRVFRGQNSFAKTINLYDSSNSF